MLKSLSSSLIEGGWERDGLLRDEPTVSFHVPAAGFLVAPPRAVVTGPSEEPAVVSRVESPPKRKLFHLLCSHHKSHRSSVGKASSNWKRLGTFALKPFVVAAVRDDT